MNWAKHRRRKAAAKMHLRLILYKVSLFKDLGKTHLATAFGYAACQQGMSVPFANAIDVVNTLSAAQFKDTLKAELRRYTTPALLILDDVDYLPPSTNTVPISSSKSSAPATNAVPSC